MIPEVSGINVLIDTSGFWLQMLWLSVHFTKSWAVVIDASGFWLLLLWRLVYIFEGP